MKSVIYHRFGVPQEVLEVEDVPALDPGSDEVVIALEAAPVHLADLKQIQALPWFDQYTPPRTPGYEGVGRITKLGHGVTDFRLGERVFLPVRFGAWREESVAKTTELWRAPEGIAAEQLALVPINLSSAWLMLEGVVPLRRGDWIIQNAANSNVGHYVMRLAKRKGYRTINVARRESLLQRLAESGGHVNLLDGDDLAERVRAAIGSDLPRLAIDAIAGDAPARLARCYGPEGGTVLTYGLLSGEPCRVPPEMLMFGGITLTGFMTFRTMARVGPARVAEMREELAQFLVEEPPSAKIAAVYRFAQVRKAVAHAARTGAEREGKIVLIP